MLYGGALDRQNMRKCVAMLASSRLCRLYPFVPPTTSDIQPVQLVCSVKTHLFYAVDLHNNSPRRFLTLREAGKPGAPAWLSP
jgi:hypothetical protein